MKHLFVLDPIEQINPSKDSSAALMQAAQRASIEIWICTPSDLQARGNSAWVVASQVNPEPWISIEKPLSKALDEFSCIWMRKDPPVDQAFLYATHLLEVAERNGVLVVNKPASLRAWNEKLGALRFSKLMAPTLVASRVNELKAFAEERYNLIGRAGHWWEQVNGSACNNCGDCVPRCPNKLPIPALLIDTHQRLSGKPRRRLWG